MVILAVLATLTAAVGGYAYYQSTNVTSSSPTTTAPVTASPAATATPAATLVRNRVQSECPTDATFVGLKSLPSDLTKVCSLNLIDQSLTAVPDQVFQMSNIKVFRIGNNKLGSLPTNLFKLTTLKSLGLATDSLTEVPADLGNLTNLVFLNLEGNSLQTLPTTVSKLTNLEAIILTGNQLNQTTKDQIKALLPKAEITF